MLIFIVIISVIFLIYSTNLLLSLLVLELIRNKIGGGRIIRLSEKSSGGGMPLNANQIIANYLASLPPKISTGTEIQVYDESEHNLSLLNELPQLALDEESEHSDSDGVGDEELHVNDFDVGSNSHDHQSIHDSDHEEIGNNPIENQIINVPQGFMQQIVLNLSPNVSPVNLDNYDQYIEKLTQKKRSKLEVTINKRLHVFSEHYPNRICIAKAAPLKDKLVFCLKEIKKNRMKAIPRTNHL